MSVEQELAPFTPNQDTILTIGVFDGVHVGHKFLFARLVAQAKKHDLLPGVITFRQHPEEVLSKTPLSFLTDLDERVRLIQAEGVPIVVPISFTVELSRLKPSQFLGLLQKHLRMKSLVIGPDFALGYGREGDIENLESLGKEMGLTVEAVPPIRINGEVVSSTAIRNALAKGDMKKVERMAGQPFRLQGPVVTGSGRGTTLGYPTANISVNEAQALPADGVYATIAYIDGKAYHSMTYIGRNPTFRGKEVRVEVYILDYNQTLYGRELKIDIIERLRGDITFKSPEELKKQIAEDVKKGKEILESGSG
jgi:riboflavin kinase/FMN adenylyltransferase